MWNIIDKLAGSSGKANSARSMFWHGRCSRSLRACRSPARFMSQCSQCFGIVKVGSPFGNLSLMSLFQSFVQSLIFRQGYCKNYLSYQNILYCVWKLTLSATTSYKNNCNTVNGLWDICAERSAIALIIYFSRNIAKTIYRIITFLDSFESWSHQLQHIKKLLLYS